jgi:hypothetical protein
MKNIQVIDGADNCTYSIYSVTDEEFLALFPHPGQDIEFIEDAIERVGDEKLGFMMRPVWGRAVAKSDVRGIQGTLFYGLHWKKKYYPTKKEAEMEVNLSPRLDLDILKSP